MVFRRLNMKTKRKNYSKELKAENCSAAEHMANTKGALINKNKRKRADISEPGMSDKIQDQVFQRPQHKVTCPKFVHQQFPTPIITKSQGVPLSRWMPLNTVYTGLQKPTSSSSDLHTCTNYLLIQIKRLYTSFSVGFVFTYEFIQWDRHVQHYNEMESKAIIAGWQSLWLQQVRTSPNAAVIDTETRGKKKAAYPWKASGRQGSPSKIPLPPLPTLEWSLERGGSWFHPFWSLRYIACTWAPLGWPCIPTRCSITASSHDLTFPLQHVKYQRTHAAVWIASTILLGRENIWGLCYALPMKCQVSDKPSHWVLWKIKANWTVLITVSIIWPFRQSPLFN